MSDAVERQIRAAIERGDFDDLPGAGRPLDGLDRPYEPDWWIRAWIARDRQAVRHADDLAAIEQQARRIWAAPTPDSLETTIDEIDTLRIASGLEPLDRQEVRRMWRSVRHHRTTGRDLPK